MTKTPPTKLHIVLLAVVFWALAPMFDAAYYFWQQANHAYPSNADTIAIPIFQQTVLWLIATPFYALGTWLVLRSYRGGRSFFAFDTTRPARSTLFSILWGGIAAVFLYSVLESAFARNWIDALSFVPWVYLFSCVRSSFAGEINDAV